MSRTSITSTRSESALRAARATDAATLRTVPVADLGDRDLAAWTALAANAAEANPFFQPEMLIPAAALYGGVDLTLIESDGRLIGALPTRRSAAWRGVPAPTLTVWRHRDAFIGTPLVAPEAGELALGALLDHARAGRAGLVAFEWLGTGGPVEREVRAAAHERSMTIVEYGTSERAALRRRPEPDYLRDSVSKGRAREMRRLRRKLGEQLGGPVEVHDRAGDPEAVEGFLAAEAAGWKGRRGTAFASTEPHADFFRSLCKSFQASGSLQLLVLTAGDTDVAWKVNFTAGDAIYCFKIAYADDLGRYSPGIQLELDFVDLFHSTRFAWSDSCASPDNDMINRLWPDRRPLSTLLVFTGGPRGAAAQASVRTAIAVRNHVRRNHGKAA